MKRTLVIILVLVLVLSLFVFAGCNKKQKELILYTESGFPPFEYPQGDKIVGVDIEIGQAIADALGMKLVIKDGNFDAIVAGINEDNAVGLAGISITKKRAKAVEFSIPYFESIQYVVYKKGALSADEDGIVSAEQVDNKKIGVQTGTTADVGLQDLKDEEEGDMFQGVTIKGYDNALIASDDIGKGCDYVIIDKHTALQIVQNNSNLAANQIAGFDEEYYAIAIKKGNKVLLNAVNWILYNLLEDGSVTEWLEKHDPLSNDE